MSFQRDVTLPRSDTKKVEERKRSIDKEQMYPADDNMATNKSPASSSGKQGKTSKQEAIAQLDLFLDDISQVTEKVKKEEEEKMQSGNTKLALTEENLKLHGEISSSDLTRRWNSMNSVVCDNTVTENEALSPRRHISYDDITSITADGSPAEPNATVKQQSKKILSGTGTTYSVASVSSQGSDSTAQSIYGLQHLNHLCKFLEQFEQLQQQNTELNKKVSNFETGKPNLPPPTSEEIQINTLKKKSSGKKKPNQRHSASFLVPSDKPPKRGKAKPSKAKYLSTLLFTSAARSVENLKQSSSQNLDKIRTSIFAEKPMHNYAVDDMELRKSPDARNMPWRNSSIKESSKRQEYSSLDYIDPAEVAYDCIDGPMPDKPEIVVSDGSLSSDIQPEQTLSQALGNSDKQSPSTTYPKLVKEEQDYRNTKKMTEWAVLQQVFPTAQVDSNLSLLSHLDSMLSHGKDQKRSSYLPILKIGSSRPRNSSAPKRNANMFLPSSETNDSSLAFHAAHAMTNQLTLTMSSSEIEMLSNHVNATRPSKLSHGAPVSITSAI